MTTALTVLDQSTLEQGGHGLDFSSKIFALKPATLNIIQQNSQVEGKKGSLRISETGDVFPEMDMVLLAMPKEKRECYSGEPGTMNRTKENLICFSRDMIRPDESAKAPQAPFCNGCPQSDWKPFRDYFNKNGIKNKALVPRCDPSWYAVMLDTKYRLPIQCFIRGKSAERNGPFERGMQNFRRTVELARASGKNPNIFDIRFKLSTKQITTGKFVSYVYEFSDFLLIKDEEREAFGAVYLDFIAQAEARKQQAFVDPGEYEDGEIVESAPAAAPITTSTEEINI